tara:strand:- start:149 stop:499 length:351 start_codon:yes stop_codon:yes gene_type:complete
MQKFIKPSYLFLLFIFLTSCGKTFNQEELIKDSSQQESEQLNITKNNMEVRFACEKDGISEFLNNGWVIVEQYAQEKICTWKSVSANKDCDLEKDKGCKITIPDKIGKEKVYLLEK